MDAFSTNPSTYLSFLYSGYATAIWLTLYIVNALALYKLSEKAGLDDCFLSFIPILQYILFFHIIDKSALNIFWFFIVLIPILGSLVLLVLVILWQVKFYSAFGISTALIIVSIIISPIGAIVMLYMGFSDSVTYKVSNRYAVK